MMFHLAVCFAFFVVLESKVKCGHFGLFLLIAVSVLKRVSPLPLSVSAPVCMKCACSPLSCHMLMFLYVQPSVGALLESAHSELTTPTRVQQEVRQEEVRN